MASSGAHVRVICLASGNGSNFKALVDAVCSGKLGNACIVRLICNQKDAHVRDRARSAGIPDTYHNMYSGGYTKKYPGSGKATSPAARESYDADLAKILLADSPSLVVCAGWMHVFSSAFLDPVASAGVSVINLHPALPGEFIGSYAIERAYAAFQRGEIKRTGVMIHKVIREVDMGPTILTAEVECKDGESLQELQERIHDVEHKLIVDGTTKVIEDIRHRE